MTNITTQFDKRREGMVILIQAAPGQGVGGVSRHIEIGDTVRLFMHRRPVLAEVTGFSEGGYTGCLCSKDVDPPLRVGQVVCFDEINVDAVFKKNSNAPNERTFETIAQEANPA
ncbi:hypothetical protein [Methyloterricola oryzae]|uniref:hypothetical protein n=1 Tax=Methyloterricola oryzae TaxID=1495050 RepID=UPI0005EB90E6|nr:hypothetical protein [Methyloterricola oryzae]